MYVISYGVGRKVADYFPDMTTSEFFTLLPGESATMLTFWLGREALEPTCPVKVFQGSDHAVYMILNFREEWWGKVDWSADGTWISWETRPSECVTSLFFWLGADVAYDDR